MLLGLVLIALVGVGLWWRGVFAPHPAEQPGRPAAEALLPELTLSVNGSSETTITPGMPLIFELMLRNTPAARAAGAGATRERLKEDLDGLVQQGKLTREQAEGLLKKDAVPPPFSAVVITVAAGRFSFLHEGSQGARPVPWRLKMVNPAAPVQVRLDEKQIAWATFVMAPEDTVSIANEAYTVRASFENRSTGQWQGKIISDPVVITVVPAPQAPTAAEQEERHLVLVEYFLALKDHDRAIGAARQALATSPQSIDGLVLLGQAQEAKGEFRAALDAYDKALEEFGQRFGGRSHPHAPVGLIRSIQRMEEKLGIPLAPISEEPSSPGRR